MFDEDGEWRKIHSSLWHPWQDKAGIRHVPTYFNASSQTIHTSYHPENFLYHVADMEEMIECVSKNGLFLLCKDPLNEHEFSYANELLGDDRATPYLSRQGNIAALRLSNKRRSGFLVPSKTWRWDNEPTANLTRNIGEIFRIFGYESTTPASLSEKILRATLPTPLGISRPSVWLRRDILDNHTGGRIDTAIPKFYRTVKEFDKNKAYAWHSRSVPSPFLCPFIRSGPSLAECLDYATGYWQCVLVAVPLPLHPIQVVKPVPGEIITRWLWTGELLDCLEAGYQLVKIIRGYGFREMSNFMEMWSDILLEKHFQAQRSDEHLAKIIKSMMVGLPGRFLRQPEQYRLVHISEVRKGDIPLMMHWQEDGDRKFSDYAMRPEYDKESTALSYIGSYIVAEMRRELYHRMKIEMEHGYHVIRSYIDCYAVDTSSRSSGSSELYRNIGPQMGQWKEKAYTNVYAEENRFIGEEAYSERQLKVKAPGFGIDQRIYFIRRYREIVQNQPV